jgi:diguanylate cyclase (GGDEF)-like protein
MVVVAPFLTEHTLVRRIERNEKDALAARNAEQELDVVALRLVSQFEGYLTRAKEIASDDAIVRCTSIDERMPVVDARDILREASRQLGGAASYSARGAIARLVSADGRIVASSIAGELTNVAASIAIPAIDSRLGTDPFLLGRTREGNSDGFEFVAPVPLGSSVAVGARSAPLAVLLWVPADSIQRMLVEALHDWANPSRALVFDGSGVCVLDSNNIAVGRRAIAPPSDVTAHWSATRAFGDHTDAILKQAARSPHLLGALVEFANRADTVRIRPAGVAKLDIVYVRTTHANASAYLSGDAIANAIAILAGLITFAFVYYKSGRERYRIEASPLLPALSGVVVFCVLFGATIYATRAFDERGRENVRTFTSRVEEATIQEIQSAVDTRIAYFSYLDDQLQSAAEHGDMKGEFYNCARLSNKTFPDGMLVLFPDEDNPNAEPIAAHAGEKIDFRGRADLPPGSRSLEMPFVFFDDAEGRSPSLVLDAPFRLKNGTRSRLLWKINFSEFCNNLLTPARSNGFDISVVRASSPGHALFPLGSHVPMEQLGSATFRIPQDGATEVRLALVPHPDWFGAQTSRTLILYLGFIIAFAGTIATCVVVGALGTYRRASRIDPLTGLHNRIEFDEILDREVARARRHGRPLSLAMIDLDHFKQVNDTHGHAVGDAVLRNVAEELRKLVRTSDTVFRHGGEEFALLLPETSEDSALIVMERMREHLARHEFDGHARSITFSCGIAAWDGNESTDSLLARADAALYEAKTRGRNCVLSARLLDIRQALRVVPAAG